MNLSYLQTKAFKDYTEYTIYCPKSLFEIESEVLSRTLGDDHNQFKTKEDEVNAFTQALGEIEKDFSSGKIKSFEIAKSEGDFIKYFEIKKNIKNFIKPYLKNIDDLHLPSYAIKEIKSLIKNWEIEVPEIIEEYLKTKFFIKKLEIDIKIGKTDKSLKEYMVDKRYESFCIITAHNPYPEVFDDKENIERNQGLKESLKPYKKLAALGRSNSSEHPDEDSFIVFDIDLESAMALMSEYEQLAIVYGDQKVTSLLIDPEKQWEIE